MSIVCLKFEVQHYRCFLICLAILISGGDIFKFFYLVPAIHLNYILRRFVFCRNQKGFSFSWDRWQPFVSSCVNGIIPFIQIPTLFSLISASIIQQWRSRLILPLNPFQCQMNSGEYFNIIFRTERCRIKMVEQRIERNQNKNDFQGITKIKS